jgi:ornithine cyclodeaminase/alanine dehydrogenase-like protein (mu-crystallin family)
MVLLIRDTDINAIEIKPEEVIEAVEDGYRQESRGHAFETPRVEIKIKGRNLPHISPGTTSIGQGIAYLEESKALMISHAYHFSWHKYITQIIDPDNGETLAIILRGREPFGVKTRKISVGGLRTGAAAAVGSTYLAREDIDAVGVIGTGRVGRASLVCLQKVRDFNKVYSHSGRRRDDEFSRDMEKTLGVDVIACDNPEMVVREAEILVTATYATEPIVKGEWLNEGTHINGMGADDTQKAELDINAISRMDKIVVDSDKCMTIGEIALPIKMGLISTQGIHAKIGEVITGKKPGRESHNEITFFESDGTHIQSASVSWLIYNKVKEAGFGIDVSQLASFFINP